MKSEQQFFQELIRLYRPFENQLNVQLNEHGLHRAQWTILYNLYHNGPASNVEISNYQSVEKPTITRTVHQLEEAGYIERIPGKDRREKRMQLTKAGIKVYESARKTIDLFEQTIMEGISEEKQLEMMEMMNKIKENLNR
jgi:MarR family transcriptional regulator, transcriptional regulator for hemolysin